MTPTNRFGSIERRLSLLENRPGFVERYWEARDRIEHLTATEADFDVVVRVHLDQLVGHLVEYAKLVIRELDAAVDFAFGMMWAAGAAYLLNPRAVMNRNDKEAGAFLVSWARLDERDRKQNPHGMGARWSGANHVLAIIRTFGEEDLREHIHRETRSAFDEELARHSEKSGTIRNELAQ